MAAGAATSLIGGIGKLIGGAKRANDARKAIDSYQRQQLNNAYGDLQVSTLGADLQREEMARSTASMTDAARQGGVRGLAQLGRIQAQNNIQSQQIAAGLDQQQRQIDMMKAQDDARIRQMQETREQQDLAGLGQAMEVGRQDMYSGIGDVAQTAFSAHGMMGGMGKQGGNDEIFKNIFANASNYANTGMTAGFGFNSSFDFNPEK